MEMSVPRIYALIHVMTAPLSSTQLTPSASQQLQLQQQALHALNTQHTADVHVTQ